MLKYEPLVKGNGKKSWKWQSQNIVYSYLGTQVADLSNRKLRKERKLREAVRYFRKEVADLSN